MSRAKFHGSITALVTPFKKGKVDEKSLRSLVNRQLDCGINGLVPVGTTGESPTLSHAEHQRVIQVVIETARRRVPVIAGTGSNSTDEAISLTRFAKKKGADGALMVSPYYNKPTQEGLYRHFEKVARAVDIPIVLYNIPSRTGVTIAPETVARLARIPNIVGIKEATGSMDQTSHTLSLCDIDVLSGDDSLTLPLMALGAKGVISVIANLLPKDTAEMVHAFQAGDLERARRIHYRMFPLCRALFFETNPIPVKKAMGWMRLCSDELRLPLVPMGKDNAKKLAQAMKEYGLKW
ncbi:MAG: 4-hydroxy-tetrahydrodipicolinate synthase [Omnitrophica bacterium RIFCSPHIGHO2_02_FULL_63_14]|nr:MAG: 4-hydroxy-tetrahydrodipicolinate synthase [Omnitrophica bacterium RIFCSPHIGHO2_02_FULL_63_14]